MVSRACIAPSAEALHLCSRGHLAPTSSRWLRLLVTVLEFIADLVRHFNLIYRSITDSVRLIKWPGCSPAGVARIAAGVDMLASWFQHHQKQLRQYLSKQSYYTAISMPRLMSTILK